MADVNNKEQQEKVIQDAFFIGVVQVSEAKLISDGFYSYKLQPMQSFSGKLDNKQDVYYTWSSCSYSPPKAGEIYTIRILKEKDRLGIAGWCPDIHPATWMKWQDNLAKTSAYQKIQKSCSDGGGEWIFDHSHGSCHYASPDFGKICQDNNECAGYCETEVKGETLSKVLTTDSRLYSLKIATSGKCSKWKNISLTRYHVMRGYLSD